MAMPKDGYKIDKAEYEEMLDFYKWAVKTLEQGGEL